MLAHCQHADELTSVNLTHLSHGVLQGKRDTLSCTWAGGMLPSNAQPLPCAPPELQLDLLPVILIENRDCVVLIM